jgi:hypothetical protein
MERISERCSRQHQRRRKNQKSLAYLLTDPHPFDILHFTPAGRAPNAIGSPRAARRWQAGAAANRVAMKTRRRKTAMLRRREKPMASRSRPHWSLICKNNWTTGLANLPRH